MTEKPFLSRLRAMGLPMRPSPMNPTVCDIDVEIDSLRLNFSCSRQLRPKRRAARRGDPVPSCGGALEQERQVFAQHVSLFDQAEADAVTRPR